MGGLPGRARVIETIRNTEEHPVLLVDSGNLFFKKVLTAGDNRTALIKAHGIARAYAALKYDAVGVSGADLTAGKSFFMQYQDGSIPWVSANVFDDSSELFFPAHIIKESGGLTVGIIGLSGSVKNLPAGITVGDWRSALHREVALLDPQCDILMVLSSLPDRQHQAMVEAFPQIDLVITGSPRSGNLAPKIFGNCLLTQSGSRGKYIGKLEIQWNSAGKWQADTTRSLAQLKQRLASIERQIKQMQLREVQQPGKYTQKLDRMNAYQQTVQKEIEQLKLTHSDTAQVPARRFDSAFLPVRPSTSPATMQQIVREIQMSITTLNRSRSEDMNKDSQVASRTLQLDTMANFHQCAECHPVQVAFWQETDHAKAYTTLELRGQVYNLDCLPCHVTGGGVDHSSTERDKLLLLGLPEYRKNIGCGSCHGQTRQHMVSSDKPPTYGSPHEELCTRCHTPERDSHFSFEPKLARVACPSGE